MLQYVDNGGYTWYFNHLLSFIISCGFLFYLIRCLKIKKKDKILHAVMSAGIVFVLLHLLWFFKWSWWIAPAAAMVVGFGKEIADKLNPKKKLFDWMDIVADLIGMGSVTLVYIFSFLLSK